MAMFSKNRYAAAAWLLASLSSTAAHAAPSAPQAVEAQADKLIRQRLADAGLEQPDIKLQSLPPRDLPSACAAPWLAEASDSRAFSRMRFDIACPASGWRGVFIVRAAVSARVAVAARDLPSSVALSAEDISWARRPVTDSADLFGSSAPPIGLAPRGAIRQDQALRRRQLQPPQWVKRGDIVNITVRQNGIEVSNAGEALANGREGETIRVRSPASGKILRARVSAEGEVTPLE
ncbi:flagellar basal body P-ring formation chaperone FlgA [Chromobacterium phragmitis]|uniref:Flagella basal body P-ring formation protein FlgA n=1 Tax=Chromobacterium phragmitis TaxID=2202141 RepID=A0A344UMV1_9NEIS|nr:flagellar basal body P-ring formation chaperone FlgA [Chromobacterium phragmitis]AXE36599.1 flagella basal body P-ring formation protein FlgA [Chromobacterium phragmitis]